MAYTKCAYNKCENTSMEFSMFRFPVHDKDRLVIWLRNSGNLFLDSLTLEELKRRYICSAHFPESSINKGIRSRLIGPAVPISFQCSENQRETASTSACMNKETDPLSSPEFLKVKTPVKFYTKRARTFLEDRSLSPSPAPSIFDGPLPPTPTRLSRRCLFEQPKKRLSRKCIFEESVDDTPRRKKLKQTVSSLKRKNFAQSARIRRLREKIGRPPKHQYENDVARIVAEMQTRKKKEKTKWTDEQKNFCLSVFYKSPSNYCFMRRHGMMLAAPSTIRGWLSQLNYKPGLCEDLFAQVKKKFKYATIKERACVLCFDEMSIMTDLEYSKKFDIIEGFEDLGADRRTNKIAKYALVFLIRGLHTSWKFPLAYFLSTTNVKADVLQTILKSLLNKLFDSELLPKSVVCDQMSTNQKLYKGLGVTDEHPFFYVNSRKIFAIFDVPHLIKSIRNNLLNCNFILDGEEVAFSDIIKTFEIDQKSSRSRSLNKLTQRHLMPNAFQKMTVRLATQVFSNSVSAAMKTVIATGELKSSTANSTARFIKIVNDMFDGLNSGRKYDKNPSRHAISRESKHVTLAITNGINTFKNIQKIIHKTNKAGVTKKTLARPPCFDGVVQSCEAILQLFNEEITDEAVTYITTKKLNQDVLENLFAKFRQKGGCNRNPTAKLLRTIFRSNFINNVLKVPDNSNCQDDGENFIGVSIGLSPSNTPEGQASVSSYIEDEEALPSCSSAGDAVADSSHCVFKNVASTTTLEECSTAYFAGYLAKSCLNKFKNCSICSTKLVKNVDLDDDRQMLILNKSYTDSYQSIKLKMPSDGLLALLKLAVDCFNCHFETIGHKNAVASRLFNAIKKYLECEAHDLLYNVSCMDHIEFIIKKMIIVKINFYCKSTKKVADHTAKLKILKNK